MDTKKNVQTMLTEIRTTMRGFTDADRFNSYLEMQGRLHRLTAANVMIIMQQQPNASLVFGYNQWKDAYHRNVRRGQKAIYILAPHKYQYETYQDRIGPDGKPVRDANGVIIQDPVMKASLRYIPVPVFDIAQTHGEPFTEITNRERMASDASYALARVEEASVFPISYTDNMEGRIGGYMDNDTLKIDTGLSDAAKAREIIRVAVHHDSISYDYPLAARRLYTEAVTYAVCSAYGIDCEKPSAARCKEVFADKNDKFISDFLRSVRNDVHETMDQIEVACERQKEAEKEAEKAKEETKEETKEEKEEQTKEPEPLTEESKEKEKEEPQEETEKEEKPAETAAAETAKAEEEKEEPVETEEKPEEKETETPDAEKEKKNGKIEDFGEKIGGARKDLAAMRRGINVADTVTWTEAEKRQLIKKDTVWKHPDYMALKNEGVPVEMLYAVKKIRDSLPSSPVYLVGSNAKADQERYINFVGDVRDEMERILKERDMGSLRNMDRWLMDNGYVVRSGFRSFAQTDKSSRLISNACLRSFLATKDMEYLRLQAGIKQFLFTPEEKILSGYRFIQIGDNCKKDTEMNRLIYHPYEGNTWYYYSPSMDIDLGKLKPGTWIGAKDGKVEIMDKASKEEARAAAIEKGKEEAEMKKASRKRKKVIAPATLECVKREGGEDYRKGRDVTGDDMIKTFGFKGGEYGNWLSDKERQANLNAAYDAFRDLAKALNISEKDISFGGQLSIAFGARGLGGSKRAAAHYEPDRQVINLTKMYGAGSLAHEWIHALDDTSGRETGLAEPGTLHFLSSAARSYDKKEQVPEAYRKLVNTMFDVPLTKEKFVEMASETIQQKASHTASILSSKVMFNLSEISDQELTRLNDLIDNCEKELRESTKYRYYDYDSRGNIKADKKRSPALDALAKYARSIGRSQLMTKNVAMWYNLQRSDIASMADAIVAPDLESTLPNKREDSKFYTDAKALESGKAYWATPEEMLARAGAVYVKDKLEKMGIRNDYLVGHAEVKSPYEASHIFTYPVGLDRERIEKAFDGAIQELKDRGILHEPERQQERAVQEAEKTVEKPVEQPTSQPMEESKTSGQEGIDKLEAMFTELKKSLEGEWAAEAKDSLTAKIKEAEGIAAQQHEQEAAAEKSVPEPQEKEENE